MTSNPLMTDDDWMAWVCQQYLAHKPALQERLATIAHDRRIERGYLETIVALDREAATEELPHWDERWAQTMQSVRQHLLMVRGRRAVQPTKTRRR